MNMERNIITMMKSGTVIIPKDITCVWMNEPELVELFGVIAPTLRTAIRAVYKSGVLNEYKVQKYIRLNNGCHADVFSFQMIVALAFRIDSFGAEQVRKLLFERLYMRKEKASIFFSLGMNSMETTNYQA
mgnify:CR=1 FL=1